MDIDAALKNPALCPPLLKRLKQTLDGRPLRFMEVCGTHTVSIFRSGLRSLLPSNITHLSGPGCPVCVTHDAEVAAFLDLAQRENLIIATFGDLLRVPGPNGTSLKHAQSQGAHISIVYSPLDALTIAANNPKNDVVFLGVGFETTAPTIAATLMAARQQQLDNFSVLAFHKLVPPALQALLTEQEQYIDAFLLPGHVSTIIGLAPYSFLPEHYHVPGIVAGFEAADILLALCLMAESIRDKKPVLHNAYERAVSSDGNPKAREIMAQVFETTNALWRGLGEIPQSGLRIRKEWENMDAITRFDLTLSNIPTRTACRCGDVLKGRISPADCPLFGKKCTPAAPVGPCMVSTEGSCAAYFKYAG